MDAFETGQLWATQLTEATAGARTVAGFLPAANERVNTLKGKEKKQHVQATAGGNGPRVHNHREEGKEVFVFFFSIVFIGSGLWMIPVEAGLEIGTRAGVRVCVCACA